MDNITWMAGVYGQMYSPPLPLMIGQTIDVTQGILGEQPDWAHLYFDKNNNLTPLGEWKYGKRH